MVLQCAAAYHRIGSSTGIRDSPFLASSSAVSPSRRARGGITFLRSTSPCPALVRSRTRAVGTYATTSDRLPPRELVSVRLVNVAATKLFCPLESYRGRINLPGDSARLIRARKRIPPLSDCRFCACACSAKSIFRRRLRRLADRWIFVGRLSPRRESGGPRIRG